MIDLASLRLSEADEADLRWYWCAAERELGLKSNFDAIIQRQFDRDQAAFGRIWAPKTPDPASGITGLNG